MAKKSTKDNYLPIPVKVAEQIGFAFKKQVVCIIALDQQRAMFHCTTWGETARHKEQAAELGPELIRAAGGIVELAKAYEDFREPTEAANNAERLTRLRAALSPEAVEAFCESLPWSTAATDDERTLVMGNLRNFAEHLRKHVACTCGGAAECQS